MGTVALLLAALALVSAPCVQATKIEEGNMPLKYSSVAPGNVLPAFLFLQGAEEGGSTRMPIGGGRGRPLPFVPDDSCLDDIFEGANPDLRSPQLPWLTQDLWGCEREDKTIPVVYMENDKVKVTVAPGIGGKIWGIYDKVRGKEMLYHNPAHQPANIGARKAWVSGGCEWNWSPGLIGHSAFSESPTWTAVMDTEKGPLLRVYEFDRYNGTVWQVDMLLPNDSDTVWVHPRITNPTPTDQRGYWWTCVAHHVTPKSRVITPATHVAETGAGAMRHAPWPLFALQLQNASFSGLHDDWKLDGSYLGNILHGDYFVRIPKPRQPYVAHAAEDGYTVIHGHPLNGSKFFTWGQNGPGRFMQDFLSADAPHRGGDYAELQIGPAPTQMQTFPLPKESILQWTEWFKAFTPELSKIHSANYDDATGAVDAFINSQGDLSKQAQAEMDAFFDKWAATPPTANQFVARGMPWGGLEALRLKMDKQHLTAGTLFPLEDTPETRPWIQLIQNGTFLADTLALTPVSYQTTAPWEALIAASAASHGMTWLHALHLATIGAERGAVDQPRRYYNTSMKLRPSAVAARGLAVLEKDPADAWPWYQKAWALATAEDDAALAVDPARTRLQTNLAVEMCFFLQDGKKWTELKAFIAALPAAVAAMNLDAVLTSQIKVALYEDHAYTKGADILQSNCFPTYASDRKDLMHDWNYAMESIAAQKKGAPLTPVEAHNVRIANPVPRNIGCAYGSSYCRSYW